ncbi:hypothetical protein [Streptomyces variegatus]|uniref:hypothetical protein n=1 Tax=Streptomyces variegatus TaxID=284040 RepID=UPI003C2CA0DE
MSDAVAVGVPHDVLGEVPIACVRAAGGGDAPARHRVLGPAHLHGRPGPRARAAPDPPLPRPPRPGKADGRLLPRLPPLARVGRW